MKREEEIKKAANSWLGSETSNGDYDKDDFGFIAGAIWADDNPPIMNELIELTDEEIDTVFENVELKSKLEKAKQALSEILEFHFYGHHAEKFKKILKELNDT